jgi:hypothetical protein
MKNKILTKLTVLAFCFFVMSVTVFGEIGRWQNHSLNSILPLPPGANDNYGTSVSVSGNYAIVGVPKYNNPASFGEAVIYQFSGGNWNYVTTLSASDKTPGDCFGFGVSISGNFAIVGAYKADGSHTNQGIRLLTK